MEKETVINIYDALGREILVLRTHEPEIKIDLKTLSPGIYSLMADNGSRSVVNQFVKQ